MDLSLDGKQIQVITWPDQSILRANETDSLTMSATYQGDRHEYWVILTRNGVEISRHNARFIETIAWLNESHE